MKVDELMKKYYPGDSKNGTLIFYQWLRSSMQEDFVVLNIGAGPASPKRIRSLKGEVRKVVGADIDGAVLSNRDIDEAHLIHNDVLPFDGSTFDAAWADYVLEHVEKPAHFLSEIYRVLKPGAPFFFRTPNKYHYVSFVARFTPHWVHHFFANKMRGLSGDAYDPYPTFYRLNSKKEIIKCSTSEGFREITLRFIEAEPSYLVFHWVPFLIGVFYERTVNRVPWLSHFRSNIMGKLVK